MVAIRGEMKKGFIVGCNVYSDLRKHGVPSTDTNNVVLLVKFPYFKWEGLRFNNNNFNNFKDNDQNPLGTRILSPIPANLLNKRDNMIMGKVLALSTKFF